MQASTLFLFQLLHCDSIIVLSLVLPYSDRERSLKLFATTTIHPNSTSNKPTSSVFGLIDNNHGMKTTIYSNNKEPKVCQHEDIIMFCIILLGGTSAVQLIIIITPLAVVISSILLLSFIVMICCIKRGTKNKGTLVCTHV